MSRRSRRRLGALAALTVVVVLALAAPASAHATLLTTTPSPGGTYDKSPPAVDLRFSEPVEVSIGDIRVFDGKAQRVVTGAPKHPGGNGNEVSVSLPELDDGTYVVTWRVVSADTHPIDGAFTFQVGTQATVKNANGLAARLLSDQSGSKVVSVAYGIDRFAVFAALALLIGSVVFLVAIFPQGVAIRRSRRIVWAGWIAVAVTTILGVGLEGLYAAGLPLSKIFDPGIWRDTFDTRYGRVALLRLAILVVILPLLVWWLRRPDRRAPAWWLALMALAGVGLSLTPALAGHASAGEHVALAIPADTVHVGAMAGWLGGLVVLVAVVMPRKDPDEMRSVLVRFSAVALGAVVLLVVTGGFQAWRQIGSIDALKNTDYGRILIVKLVVFAALIIAAAFSREVVNRQFRSYDEEELDVDEQHAGDGSRAREPVAVGAVVASSVGDAGDRPSAGGRGPGGTGVTGDTGDDADDDEDWEPPDFDSDVKRLRRSLWLEVVIAAAVLAVTALLVNAAPARSVSTEPVAMTLKNSKAWVDVTIAPGTAGRNDMHFTVFAVGGGLTTVQDMQVQLTKVGADLPPFDVPLQQLGQGHYYAPLYEIPYPGEWQLIARVRLSETEETVLTGKFSLR